MSLLTSLIAYWPQNEASGDILDVAGSSYDLAEVSGSIGAATGKITGARDYEAGDTEYAEIASNSDLQTGDIDFSCGCWIKFESLVNYPVVAHKGWSTGSPTSNFEWILFYDTAASRLTFSKASGTTAVNVTNNVALTTGLWYYVNWWHDSVANTINLQINGGTIFSTSTSTGVNAGTGVLQFGASSAQALYFDGVMCEFGFWKKVLTATERSILYNYGNGMPYSDFALDSSSLTTSLISAWELDEASGNALDSHGSNELTETGGTIDAGTGLVYATARDFEAGDTEYFEIASNASLQAGDGVSFVFEAWIKPETLASFAGVVRKGPGGSSTEYSLDTRTDGKAFVFGKNTAGSVVSVNTAASSVSSGNWSQIMFGWDDGQLFVIHNGIRTSTSLSTGVQAEAFDFAIGRLNSTYFDGLIGPVRFWKRTLTAYEKYWLYNAGAGRTYAEINPPVGGLSIPIAMYHLMHRIRRSA